MFCRSCGARQPVSGGDASTSGASSGLSPRAAVILSYLPWLGWIAGIYILASAQFRRDRETRFHAYQGLYLFVAWLLVDWAIGPWFEILPGPELPVGALLHLLLIGVWIFMLVKTSRGERYVLPVVGKLAERSL
jgi:uncharacterized membrane protein